MVARLRPRGYNNVVVSRRRDPKTREGIVKAAVLGGIRVQEQGMRNSAYGADKFGFKNLAAIHWNLTEPLLYEHAVAAGEASIVAGGALCVVGVLVTRRKPRATT